MSDAWQYMYDSIFNSFIAVDVDFTSASGVTARLRACDETKGTIIPGGPGQVETIRPTCRVRAVELSNAGIDVTDLPDGTITINGKNWIVKASAMRPAPTGEEGGEIMMILMASNE